MGGLGAARGGATKRHDDSRKAAALLLLPQVFRFCCGDAAVSTYPSAHVT